MNRLRGEAGLYGHTGCGWSEIFSLANIYIRVSSGGGDGQGTCASLFGLYLPQFWLSTLLKGFTIQLIQ